MNNVCTHNHRIGTANGVIDTTVIITDGIVKRTGGDTKRNWFMNITNTRYEGQGGHRD